MYMYTYTCIYVYVHIHIYMYIYIYIYVRSHFGSSCVACSGVAVFCVGARGQLFATKQYYFAQATGKARVLWASRRLALCLWYPTPSKGGFRGSALRTECWSRSLRQTDDYNSTTAPQVCTTTDGTVAANPQFHITNKGKRNGTMWEGDAKANGGNSRTMHDGGSKQAGSTNASSKHVPKQQPKQCRSPWRARAMAKARAREQAQAKGTSQKRRAVGHAPPANSGTQILHA